MTLSYHLSVQTLNTIERSLLHSLLHKQIDSVHLAGPSAHCSCASPAIAVGRDVCRADAGAFVKILIQIQGMGSIFSRVMQVSVC